MLPVRTHLVAIRELLECARQIAAPFFVLALELGLALNSLVNLRLVLSQLPALKEGAKLGAIVLRQRCGTRTGASVRAVHSRRGESEGTNLVCDRELNLADGGELLLAAE